MCKHSIITTYFRHTLTVVLIYCGVAGSVLSPLTFRLSQASCWAAGCVQTVADRRKDWKSSRYDTTVNFSKEVYYTTALCVRPHHVAEETIANREGICLCGLGETGLSKSLKCWWVTLHSPLASDAAVASEHVGYKKTSTASSRQDSIQITLQLHYTYNIQWAINKTEVQLPSSIHTYIQIQNAPGAHAAT